MLVGGAESPIGRFDSEAVGGDIVTEGAKVTVVFWMSKPRPESSLLSDRELRTLLAGSFILLRHLLEVTGTMTEVVQQTVKLWRIHRWYGQLDSNFPKSSLPGAERRRRDQGGW